MRRLALLALCSCHQLGSSTGPTVTVLRQTAADCYELLAGPPPPSGLGAEPCTTTATGDTKLLAGIDAIQLVIDYGKLDIEASATIPGPVPAVLVDGVAVTPAPGVQPQPRAQGHTYFLARFLAPRTISNNVTIAVPVVDGYGAVVATTFQTVDLPLAVSVLQRTDTGCFTPLTAPPDAELKLEGLCASAVPTATTAGLDTLQVVVDYHTPDIASSSVVPAPVVALSVDGLTQPGVLNADVVHTDASRRRFWFGLTHAPAPASADMRIAVKALSTSPSATEVRLSTVAPRPALRIVECPGSTCEATAAVGTLHLVASLPGDVSRSVTLHSILAGAVQPDLPAVATALAGFHTEGRREVVVPSGVVDGATWVLNAQLDGEVSDDVVITLHRPAITAEVAPCPAPCTVRVGTPLGLTVTAPKGIRDRRATYTTKLAGIPGAGGNLDLSDDDNDHGLVSGDTQIVAPLTAGEWRIDVTVATYAAQTIVVNVTTP